jgi:hypothetical protein
MSATAGLMAGTQIFRDDESPMLYVFAGKYREIFYLFFRLTLVAFILKLPKRLVNNDFSGHIRAGVGWFADFGLLDYQSAYYCKIRF